MALRLLYAVLILITGTLPVLIQAEGQQDVLSTTGDYDEPRWGWNPCGYDDDPVHIDSIEISPDPPERGQNLTVTVEGETFDTVEDGAYADLLVKVGPIQILKREVDLCQEARQAEVNLTCPVEIGQHQVIHTVTLPSNIPPAMYTVNIRGYTLDDDDLTCLDLWIDFRRRKL